MSNLEEALKTLSVHLGELAGRNVVVMTDDTDLESISARVAAAGVDQMSIISFGGAAITRSLRTSYPHVSFYEAWGVDRVQRVFESMEGPGAILDFSGLEHTRRQQLFDNIVLNLASGGLYLIPDDAVDINDALNPYVEQVYGGHSSSLYRVSGEFLIKLYDENASAALSARLGSAWGAELVREPAQTFVSRARILSNNEKLRAEYCPREYAAPPLWLRRYHEVALQPGSLATLDRFVLPDSFRHHLKYKLANLHLKSPTRFQAVAPAPPTERLDGSYYLADNDRYDHFGHIMTEFVSKLWAWERVRELDPRVKLMISGKGGYEDLPNYVRRVIEGYGISPDEVEVLNRPIVVETVYGATPQFHNPRYVNHGIVETYDRIGHAIAGADHRRTRKIFLNREDGSGENSRLCHNADDVREIFESQGFEIILPEKLSFDEQVIMMNQAKIVAGFAGSAFFSSVFAVGEINLIVIGSESYDVSNEFMITSAKGGNIAHIWCTPDHPRERHWTMRAFMSDFTFDASRDSALIMQAIEQFDRDAAVTATEG